MKLINLDHSPYAARIRIQIRKKNLPIEIIAPPLPLKSPEFVQKFTLGKIPLLELDDGSYLPESVAILEYLEDCYTAIPLRPKSAVATARMRVLMSFADTHFGPALFPLFRALINPDAEINREQQIAAIRAELGKLDRLLAEDIPLSNRTLHLGDITLVPTLWYATAVLPLFGEADILGGFERVLAWWAWVNKDAEISCTLAEMDTAFRAFASTLKKT